MNKTAALTLVSGMLMTLAQTGQAQDQSPSPGAQSPMRPSANTPTATSGSGFQASGIPATGIYSPASLRVADGIAVTPTLGIFLGHNDNLNLNATNKRSSGYLTLNPRLVAETAYRENRYALGYQVEVVRYFESSRDNVENQELFASGDHVFGTRTRGNWRVALVDRYDPIGSTLRSSAVAGGGRVEPDNWRAASIGGTGRFGAEGARGRAEVDLGYFKKEYQNNRASTAAADYDSVNFAGRLYARVAPNTELLGEVRNTRFDYDINVDNLDGRERRYLVGVQWRATAATSGNFKIGVLDKDFERVRPSYRGTTWEGGVSWKPRTYSTFDVSTGRAAADPSGSGTNFILSTFVNAAWTHDWRSFFSTRLTYAHAKEEYNGINRDDRTNTIGIGASYNIRRTARAGVGYEYTRRNSNLANFDYDRNVVYARLELGF